MLLSFTHSTSAVRFTYSCSPQCMRHPGPSQCFLLEALYCTSCATLSEFSPLGECSNLHTLYLTYCHAVADISSLSRCLKLHTFDLSQCYKVTDASALGNCTALHTVDCSGCNGITSVAGHRSEAAYLKPFIRWMMERRDG